mmetsp:Transcript_8666/g.21440  ORF Transcript_8666/g.21440 Transcript_8666/m.21440 type:complete len:172 (-) Transcript_8666:39-554(-)
MGPSASRRSSSLPPDVRLAQEDTELVEPPKVGLSRSCPEKILPYAMEYIATPHGDAPNDERLAAWCAAVGCPLPVDIYGAKPSEHNQCCQGEDIREPLEQSEFCQSEELNLEGLEPYEVPVSQQGDFPAQTPSPQWTTPKGAFGTRLAPRPVEACVVSLVALLGARVPGPL